MERIHFTININASKEKVWSILWTIEKYEAWTSVFAEGSTAVSDWKEGSKILFIDKKSGNGMVSEIAERRENEFMSFNHLGEIKDGIEDTTSDRVKIWQGSKENYTLSQTNNITTLDVDMDVSQEYKDYFLTTWPKAMERIKSLAEETI